MKVGRNDPCPCGSGKKYKKCCLARDRAAPQTPVAQPQESPAARLKRAMDALPPPAPPPPRPRTPEQERAEAHWHDFESRDFDGRIALFRQTLDDAELMGDELAFEMLAHLHDGAVKHDQRPRFGQLVAELRERRPAVYETSAESYLCWMLIDALAEGRQDDVLRLARQLAVLAGAHIDGVKRAIEALGYHRQLGVLVEMSRLAWPSVESSSDIFPSYINEFANAGADYEIYDYLEHTTAPDPADTGLLERIHFFIPDPDTDALVDFIDHLTGRATHDWKLEDFALQSPRQRRGDWVEDEDEDDDESDPPSDAGAINLSRLITEFVGYLRRDEGVSYARGELVRHELYFYFVRRHAGELDPRPSMMNQMMNPHKKVPPPPKPCHPLCPERVTFDVHVDRHFGVFKAEFHTAAALFETVPAWLRFLESRRLIDAQVHARVLANLRPLHADLMKVMAKYTQDPSLARAMQAWPGIGHSVSWRRP